MRFLRLSVLSLVLLVPAFRALAADPILKITAGEKTVAFTAEEFAALPHVDAKLAEQPGQKERNFSGVAMRDLLAKAGAPLGDKLRGPAQSMVVLVRAKDNYTVVFALAEFDEAFSTRTILLADKEDGEILPPSAAPLRVVTPGDKRGARSIRQVTSIELVSLAKP